MDWVAPVRRERKRSQGQLEEEPGFPRAAAH